MSKEYIKLVKYVNAATDLAEAIEADIKSKNRRVSNKTVSALSSFIAAAHAVQKLIDQVQASSVKLN